MTLERLAHLYSRPLPEHPCWITGGVLPKSGIMLMGGYAKIGKTFKMFDLIYALGKGGPVWGLESYKVPEPVSTLYLEGEVGVYESQRRLKLRPTPPPDNAYFLTKGGGLYLDTQTGIDLLQDRINETGAKVVLVDPISRFLIGDENSNTEVNKLFQHLDKLIAANPDLSIVLSHHFGKPPKVIREDDDYDPLSPYNFRGASKWYDAPDTLITIARQEAHQPDEWWRTVSRWEMRQASSPKKDIRLVIGEGGLIYPPPPNPTKEDWGKPKPAPSMTKVNEILANAREKV